MLYQRLVGDTQLGELLATFGEKPAVFYQHAPAPDNSKWGEKSPRYPRIDYIVDFQENPARNTSGVLTMNVWCDTEYGAEPETIEAKLRDLLHAAFAQTDDGVFCLGWARSDAFEAKSDDSKTVHTIGVTVIFDLIACPCIYTIYPDPIKAMNDWTKTVLPDAVVIGKDTIDGWLIPTRNQPVVYWRLAAQNIQRRHFTHTWLNITMEGHVYARNADDRLYNLIKLNTAQALAGHVPMEDTSPLFLKDFQCQPHLNYLITGQIRAFGYFGILQPESHLSNKGTGKKLVHINLPREIIEDDVEVEVDGNSSQGYANEYPVPGNDKYPEQTG